MVLGTSRVIPLVGYHSIQIGSRERDTLHYWLPYAYQRKTNSDASYELPSGVYR